MSTEIQITFAVILVVALFVFLKFGGAKIIALLIIAGIVAAIIFASVASSIQKTVQAPADAFNSSAAVTSLATSNAAAQTSLATSNAVSQLNASVLSCLVGLILLIIVGALCVAGIIALRWWLISKSVSGQIKNTPSSKPVVTPTMNTSYPRMRRTRRTRKAIPREVWEMFR